MKKEENNSIENALEKLQKKYGKDVVMQMDKDVDFKIETISTGCFSLDEALGSGLPRGRIIEVFGKESSGKSTLTTFLVAQIQKAGGRAALIDAEMAFDGSYAKAIGVDVSKLMVAQPGSLEEGMDILRELVNTKSFDIIVVDSVAALVPKSEIEGEEMLKDSMAVQARLLGKALRILTGEISKSKTVVIFINQIREKIGIFYGAKTVTPGGRALKFFSSIRIDVQAGDKILGKGDEQIGNWLKVKMAKNKTAPPWREAEFELFYAKGIDLVGDITDFGEKIGVIKKVGNTYTFGELKLGASRDKAKEFLVNNEETYQKIREEINKLIKK
mgnify:CR=1 FL=1